MPVNESLVANPSSEELRIYRRQLYDARTHNHQRLLACMVAFYLWQNSFSQSSPIKLSRWLILLNWDADWKDLSESDVNCNHCFFFSYNGIVWETCLRLTVYAIMKRVFFPPTPCPCSDLLQYCYVLFWEHSLRSPANWRIGAYWEMALVHITFSKYPQNLNIDSALTWHGVTLKRIIWRSI